MPNSKSVSEQLGRLVYLKKLQTLLTIVVTYKPCEIVLKDLNHEL